jgi:hypothetical protein
MKVALSTCTSAVKSGQRERMVTPESTMSLAGQHTLEDMVEFEMYLVGQSQQTPWPMLRRRTRKLYRAREPYCNPVEWSAVKELLIEGFIEAASSRTFVVSKSGYQFYERQMKSHSA